MITSISIMFLKHPTLHLHYAAPSLSKGCIFWLTLLPKIFSVHFSGVHAHTQLVRHHWPISATRFFVCSWSPSWCLCCIDLFKYVASRSPGAHASWVNRATQRELSLCSKWTWGWSPRDQLAPPAVRIEGEGTLCRILRSCSSVGDEHRKHASIDVDISTVGVELRVDGWVHTATSLHQLEKWTSGLDQMWIGVNFPWVHKATMLLCFGRFASLSDVV